MHPVRLLLQEAGVDGNAQHIHCGTGIGADVTGQDHVELARLPDALQQAAMAALLQAPAATDGHAEAQLVGMAHAAFAGLEAMAQQHHRPVVAAHHRGRLWAGFLQQLVGEGSHQEGARHGSGNGAAPPGMEWRHRVNVTG